MDDGLLVGRAAGGDLDSFGQLYDRYFGAVYDFCWRVTRDAGEAAEAAEEVFQRAMRGLPETGKAASFKAWLFTIAHNVAVLRAERSGGRAMPATHEEAFGVFGVPDAAHLSAPDLAAGDPEIGPLVWEAASSLNARDYALLDLHARQGLESTEMAQVLGVNRNSAYTLLKRMKTAAADVIGGYVLARRAEQGCEGLRGAIAGFEFPPYSEEMRRAVEAHVKVCETCTRARAAFPPLEIFGALAVVAAPFSLKGEIWRDLAGVWQLADVPVLVGAGAPVAAAPVAADRDEIIAAPAGGDIGGGAGAVAPVLGMEGDGEGGNRIVLFAAAALGLLVFAFAIAGGVLLAGTGGDDDGGGVPAETETAEARTPSSTPGVAVETPTPDLTLSVTPTPEPDTPTPTAAPPTETPPPAATATLEADTATPTRTPRGGTPTPAATQAVFTFTPVAGTGTPSGQGD